jgi:hypothetical protein
MIVKMFIVNGTDAFLVISGLVSIMYQSKIQSPQPFSSAQAPNVIKHFWKCKLRLANLCDYCKTFQLRLIFPFFMDKVNSII